MKARSFLTRKLNLLLVLLILVVWSGRIASPAGGLAVAPAQPPEPTLPAATLAPTAVVAAPTATPAPPQEPTAATAPADIPKVEWFALRPEVASHWALALDPRNDTMFTLSPRNPAEFDGAGKRILALFFKQSPAFDTALNTILEVFGSKRIPVVFTALNFKGSDDLGRQALDYAVAQHFDLIFSMGSDATRFVHEHFRGGPIPVVSVVSKDPVLLGQVASYDAGSGTNIAYTSVDTQMALQMTYLQKLKPHLKNIAIMYADSNASAKKTQVKPLKDIAGTYSLKIIDVVVQDDAQARQELAERMPLAIVEMRKTDPDLQNSMFWITGSTSVFKELATISRSAGAVPVMSFAPDQVTEGDDSAVLSIGVSYKNNAHLAALYGVAILSGKAKAGDLKVGVVSPPDIAINFRKARQIGLKIPFSFFESASFVYGYDGKAVRRDGQSVTAQ